MDGLKGAGRGKALFKSSAPPLLTARHSCKLYHVVLTALLLIWQSKTVTVLKLGKSIHDQVVDHCT